MKPKTFITDPELLKDTYKVAQFELSDVYVKNDKSNPWFVLVPRKTNAVEIVDLNHEEQSSIMEEITIVSEFLKNYYRPRKINIGALGNIVSQLHIHVIVRYESDRAWPKAIWGTLPTELFEQFELENIKSNFQEFIE